MRSLRHEIRVAPTDAGWLQHHSSPRNPHLVLPPPHSLFGTTDMFSVLYKELCKLGGKSPFPTRFTPTPLTRKFCSSLRRMATFKGNTTEQPTTTFCARKRDNWALGKAGSVLQAPTYTQKISSRRSGSSSGTPTEQWALREQLLCTSEQKRSIHTKKSPLSTRPLNGGHS